MTAHLVCCTLLFTFFSIASILFNEYVLICLSEYVAALQAPWPSYLVYCFNYAECYSALKCLPFNKWIHNIYLMPCFLAMSVSAIPLSTSSLSNPGTRKNCVSPSSNYDFVWPFMCLELVITIFNQTKLN